MMTVSAMMHEDVHQRTGEQRQPNEKSEHVGPMLGEQQNPGDGGEAGEHQSHAGVSGEGSGHTALVSEVILDTHPMAPEGFSSALIRESTVAILTQINHPHRWRA
jgi:hypothetical protein